MRFLPNGNALPSESRVEKYGCRHGAGAPRLLRVARPMREPDLANFNPHVHVLATDRAFLPDATFVPLPAVPEGLLAKEFRRAVRRWWW